MKTSAIVRIVIWSIVAVLLTALLCGIIFTKNFQFDGHFALFSSDDHYANADRYIIGGGVIDDVITALDVHWIDGSVQIVPYDGDKVMIEETEMDDTDNQLRYLVENGKLTIQYRKAGGWHFGVFKTYRKDLTVKLPQETAAALTGCQVASTSAAVTINDITVQNLLQIENVSGAVTLTGVTARNADFETVSGDITAAGTFSNVTMEGVSADLQIASTTPLSSFEGDTVSGDIAITIPESTGFTVELDTVSGKLDSDFSMSVRGDRHIYGDGAVNYEIDTVSGDVYIYRAAQSTR